MIDVMPAVLATDDEAVNIGGKEVQCRRAEVGIHLLRMFFRREGVLSA